MIRLFHRQLHTLIVEGNADKHDLTSVLCTLIHLNPFQIADNGKFGFLWITGILNSGYDEHVRYRMASRVVQAIGKNLFFDFFEPFVVVQPPWIPPVLGFLSLYGKLDNTRSSLAPAFTALRILSISPRSAEFATEILPILSSTLLPAHPLRSRILALEIFTRFTSGWFAPQMKDVPSKVLNNLLQAVDDPFRFSDLPLPNGKPLASFGYQPMIAVVVLIKFASSDLWRNHLRRSNFASCEEAVSTREGKSSAFGCMLAMERNMWPELLCTATKIEMAIRCLEELQCFNPAEVVIMWARAVGVVGPVGHDYWRLVGRETLRFYLTHGTRRLTALKQHIIETAGEPGILIRFFRRRYRGTAEPQVGNNQGFIPMSHPRYGSWHWYQTYFSL